jgi:hypothetical protein
MPLNAYAERGQGVILGGKTITNQLQHRKIQLHTKHLHQT